MFIKKSKKFILAFIAAISASVFAQNYQIANVEYKTEGAFGFGKTNPYALALNL